MKFGGKALADARSMRQSVTHIIREVERGHQVVVVTSAMAGTTDHLIKTIHHLASTYSSREYDVVVSSGEQITAGLLAILLGTHNMPAQALMGWQLPIVTNTTHGCADIVRIHTDKIEQLLQAGIIPIVTGFQGITAQGDIATLGRGGSDLTATALASYLGADSCDFYKDVDGIYSANPHLVKEARRLEAIDYANLLRIVQLGARVLAPKAVAWAMQYAVPLRVFSFLDTSPKGTVISPQILEKPMRMIVTPSWTETTPNITLYCLGLPEEVSLDHPSIELISRTPTLTELRVPSMHLAHIAQLLYAFLEPALG